MAPRERLADAPAVPRCALDGMWLFAMDVQNTRAALPPPAAPDGIRR